MNKLTTSERIDYLFSKINWGESWLDAQAVEIMNTLKDDIKESQQPPAPAGSEHTVNNPLRLIWRESQYKVNKPEQDTQELVSLAIAQELLKSLEEAVELLTALREEEEGKVTYWKNDRQKIERMKAAIKKNGGSHE